MDKPEDQATLLVRHLATGTPCQDIDCEECRLQWVLTGNVYLTVTKRIGLVHTD